MGRAFAEFFSIYIQNIKLGGVNVTSIRALYFAQFHGVKLNRVVSGQVSPLDK